MVEIKAHVGLEWAEEGNLPKKPILKAMYSQYLRSVRYTCAHMSTDHPHLYIRVDEEMNQVRVYCFQLL